MDENGRGWEGPGSQVWRMLYQGKLLYPEEHEQRLEEGLKGWQEDRDNPGRWHL